MKSQPSISTEIDSAPEGALRLVWRNTGLLHSEAALRELQTELMRLSARQVNVQECERRRIALELHDGLGQVLTVIKLTIDEAISSIDTRKYAKTANALRRLSPQVKSAIAELRRIAMNLRPSTLDDLGIVATLSWYLREFEMTCTTMMVERDICIREADVPEPLKISIFRILQEATGNALKYAKADRIKVGLTRADGVLRLEIADNGCGFDPNNAVRHRDFTHGIGLQSMRERAELSGGCYELESARGRGTRIVVRWPRLEASDPVCPVVPRN